MRYNGKEIIRAPNDLFVLTHTLFATIFVDVSVIHLFTMNMVDPKTMSMVINSRMLLREPTYS
jgi:hypothetical protein